MHAYIWRDHYEIDGVVSNRQFLSAVLENDSFKAGTITTGFIDAEFNGGFVAALPEGKRRAQLLALGTAIVAGQMAERSQASPDRDFVAIDQAGNRAETSWQQDANGQISVVVDGRKQNIFGRVMAPISLFDGTINEVPLAIQVRHSGHHVNLSIGAARLSMSILPKRFATMLDHMPVASSSTGADEICAPMPGQLTRLLVAVGDDILPGQDVVIIEAMKMENVLKSEAKGSVSKVHVAEGDNLNVDDLILSLDLAD